MLCPECQGFELGYRLVPAYWNKGLATEVASAWVSHSVRRLGLKDLMAFSHPENLASVRVLEKRGFVFSHQQRLMGMEATMYRLPNDYFATGSCTDKERPQPRSP